MAYYEILSGLKKPETLIEFEGKGRADRLFGYFISDTLDGKFLEYTTPIGVAQEDMKESDLDKLDYLDAVIGIPIFSEKVVDKFSLLLAHEVKFYPIEIKCKSKTKTFFLTKIIRYEAWIDHDKSEYRTLFDGSKLLRSIATKSTESEFYFAKDTVSVTDWAVSEKFKRLIEKNGMKMRFHEI